MDNIAYYFWATLYIHCVSKLPISIRYNYFP